MQIWCKVDTDISIKNVNFSIYFHCDTLIFNLIFKFLDCLGLRGISIDKRLFLWRVFALKYIFRAFKTLTSYKCSCFFRITVPAILLVASVY